MGVSGLGLARAVKVLGGNPVVYDQKQNDNPFILSAVDALDAISVPAITGWHGRLDPQDHDLLIVSPGFPQLHMSIRDMLAGGQEVWSEVEFAYRVSKAPILAITGTNGKSTTTVMLWSMLNKLSQNAVLCGNIAGSGYPEITLTEAALNSTTDQVLVAEISSYQLEWVSEFRPRVAAITNITPDHMDRYKFFHEYFNTKLRIFDAMGEGDSVVYNLDEPSLLASLLTEKIPFSASMVGFSPSGTTGSNGSTNRIAGVLQYNDKEYQLGDLPLIGEHNITNAMMALEMASQFGGRSDAYIEALMEFKGLANRMERLGQKNGVQVINNSMCTNPAAVIASSKGLAGVQHIIMGGITKNLDFTPVGDYLKDTNHKVYVFGDKPEHFNAILGGTWPTFDSLEAAFSAATQEAQSGEYVLLAPGCASAEPYANFKERGEAFRQMAANWLAKEN